MSDHMLADMLFYMKNNNYNKEENSMQLIMLLRALAEIAEDYRDARGKAFKQMNFCKDVTHQNIKNMKGNP